VWHFVVIQFLGCIECMRCSLYLLMFAVSLHPSVCLSRMHRMALHSEADLCASSVCGGHSVQPLPNDFGLLSRQLIGPADWVYVTPGPLHCAWRQLPSVVVTVTWWSGSDGTEARSRWPTGFLQCFDTVACVINTAALVTIAQCNTLVARRSRQLIGPADWFFVTLGPLRCD